MTVPFTLQPDGLRLPGVGVTLFTSDNDNPNGELVGNAAGDLCITTEPALYQWSADATPTWLPVGTFTNGVMTLTAGGGFVFDAYFGGAGVFVNAADAVTINSATAASTLSGVTVEINPSEHPWTFNADGSLTLPAGPRLYSYGTNPNGVLFGNATGDLCVTPEPALYQWNAGLATPAWVGVLGFDGQYTGTSGISLTDTSSGGVYLYQNPTGGGEQSALGIFQGEVAFETSAGVWSMNPDGSFSLPNGTSLFSYASNPNGNVAATSIGDVCVTSEPAFYQATAADNAHWVRLESSPSYFQWSLNTPVNPYFCPNNLGQMILDGVAMIGDVTGSQTVPVFTYPPGAVILDGVAASITNVPPSTDNFDMEMYVSVVSLDGTNQMGLHWFESPTVGASGSDFTATTPSVSGSSGSDLVSDGNGGITTTAGGIYGITAYFRAFWD